MPVAPSCGRSTGTCDRLHDGATIRQRSLRPDATLFSVPSVARIGAPHVAPVHHTERQPAVGRDRRVQFRPAADEVEMQTRKSAAVRDLSAVRSSWLAIPVFDPKIHMS
jgi:hypothetical protein